jgi:uncharacterized protein YjiS (DUF1127 family)
MSLINLFHAAAAAMARRRQRRRAYHELMALDDRSLADIGIHRSQIPALVEGLEPPAPAASLPDAVTASAFGYGAPRLASGQRWLPPV